MTSSSGYCPLCGKNQPVSAHLTTRDFLLSRSEFSIVRCVTCDLCYTHPPVPEEEIGRYYAFSDYAPYRVMDPLSPMARLRRAIRRYIPESETSQIIRLLNARRVKRILEIGPGAGALSKKLLDAGFAVSAVELDPSCAQGLRNYGIDCVTGTVSEGIRKFESECFDAVIMRHVFEHIYNPRAVLKSLRRLLSQDGIMVLSMPDASSREAKLFGKYWIGWDVPRHVTHYAPSTLNAILSLEGFASEWVAPEYYGTSFIESIELLLFSRPAPAWFHLPIYYSWRVWAPFHFRIFGSGTMSAVVRKSPRTAVPGGD